MTSGAIEYDVISGTLMTYKGSAIVSVMTKFPHSLNHNDRVSITGATSFNGILADELNISFCVTVDSPIEFTYISKGIATRNGTGGGNEVMVNILKPSLFIEFNSHDFEDYLFKAIQYSRSLVYDKMNPLSSCSEEEVLRYLNLAKEEVNLFVGKITLQEMNKNLR